MCMLPDQQDSLGRPLSGSACQDSALGRALSLGFTSLTAVVTALKQAAGANGSGVPSSGAGLVPWRDSPLTRWLQPALGSALHVLFLATVAPGPEAAAETLATLSFTSRLRTSTTGEGMVVSAIWDEGTRSVNAATLAGAPLPK